MPRQNRVTPFGEIIVTEARGTFLGNRGGCFHDAEGNLTSARWASRHWLICVLEYNGHWRQVMTPGGYTELFFLDEATALAAGHRPCSKCRRADFTRYVDAWRVGNPERPLPARAVVDVLDRHLHAERTNRLKEKVTFRSALEDIPPGTFVVLEEQPAEAHLVMPDGLLRWTVTGYAERQPRPTGVLVTVLTPPSSVGALRAGYTPALHASAAYEPGHLGCKLGGAL